ncbi:MAG: hypothetical protein US40_C0004G0084 [Candidatus Roizmanbacteria bacterium GW2011_GWC2_37_13]|uniref:SH3b domain-containing protein n=1 Tax=Candidatus Roizmanbacteria bacterium GW2011_GWC2_37_13 TaxID=1618486 RepID=A0A0G0IPE1_9BACT|nr:MAG: hypothetical protein US38_C0001G0071 [Candidatus Roizmanbacteria bacterium GW2011_GWC1_37_12]KKQ26049.1 MAG: hypothetical protein US40_C0004G0084 [Candidatus Roizmanbacteria bacterium GW2011_GWC2_37_13]
MFTKQIIVIIIAFLTVLFSYSSAKKFLLNRFDQIEKKQAEILQELKKNRPTTISSTGQSPSSDLIQEVGRLKAEVAKLKDQVEEQDDILGLSETSLTPILSLSPTKSVSINFVTISDRKWQSVEVYETKSSSSKIIGQAVYGKYYPYTEKENGYYFINLNDDITGWIHSQFVKEY